MTPCELLRTREQCSERKVNRGGTVSTAKLEPRSCAERPKTFVARYAHLDFVCENVQKEGSCYVTEDGYRLRFVHRATTAVKLRDAPLPKLAVVEVRYTAPSRTRHRLRSAMHTTNAIRKEEGSCAGCP